MIVAALSWLMAGVTLYVTVALGRKYRHAWLVSAVAQLGWATLGVVTGADGMVALALVMLILNLNNWRAWR